ncbi:MAG TPA: YARHG domain-containing protein [Hyphomicrobiales bacterium]|nr:YARHG domain-containing protein [Hyphomicrobiales bacterium]
MSSRIVVAAFILLCALFHGTPEARAGCYENVGCSNREHFPSDALKHFSCQNLAFLRNSIYAENGYCFKSTEYSAVFLKETCRFNNDADVPLNDYERANITAIVEAERGKGCR